MDFLTSIILSIVLSAGTEQVITAQSSSQKISPPSTTASAPAQKERHDN